MPSRSHHSALHRGAILSPKNPAASAYDRLLKLSKESGRRFDELLLYYGIERFLFRLSQSEHASKFVLKGALMFHVWNPKAARATRDIDFLGRMDNELDSVAGVVQEICSIEIEDGLLFDPKSVKAGRIKEDADYEGVRVSFMGKLATAKVSMQLDIGFGDEVHPQAKIIIYPALLKDESPRLNGYPRESVIAEKFQAMVQLGELNSRMKDFYDIWFLAKVFDFDGAVLSRSIQNTFERRNTKIEPIPMALTLEFAKKDDKQMQWTAFIKRSRLGSVPIEFSEIVEFLSAFLLPIAESLNDGDTFKSHWKAAGPWQ